MPFTRRQNRREYECVVCKITFMAARDHAECCSPKCRKALSRERAARVAVAKATNGLDPEGPIKCVECGTRRAEGYKQCPVCASTRFKR